MNQEIRITEGGVNYYITESGDRWMAEDILTGLKVQFKNGKRTILRKGIVETTEEDIDEISKSIARLRNEIWPLY